MKSMAWQATPTPVLDLLPSLLTTKTNRPRRGGLTVTTLIIPEDAVEADVLAVYGRPYDGRTGAVEVRAHSKRRKK